MEFAELIVTGSTFIEWINNLTKDAETTIRNLLALIGTIVGVVIIVRNPTVSRSIIGIVVGGLIIALPYIIPGFGNMFSNEVSSSAVVIQETVPQQLSVGSPTDSAK